jgi:hypothetical protein
LPLATSLTRCAAVSSRGRRAKPFFFPLTLGRLEGVDAHVKPMDRLDLRVRKVRRARDFREPLAPVSRRQDRTAEIAFERTRQHQFEVHEVLVCQ